MPRMANKKTQHIVILRKPIQNPSKLGWGCLGGWSQDAFVAACVEKHNADQLQILEALHDQSRWAEFDPDAVARDTTAPARDRKHVRFCSVLFDRYVNLSELEKSKRLVVQRAGLLQQSPSNKNLMPGRTTSSMQRSLRPRPSARSSSFSNPGTSNGHPPAKSRSNFSLRLHPNLTATNGSSS